MKKVLILTVLVLTIATSIVAGTLAVYNINLGTIAEGSVIAKEFKLTGEGLDNFIYDVKIAPTETVTMDFTVSNFDGAITSETNMDVAIKVDVKAATGKSVIEPVNVVVKDNNGNVVSTGSLTNGTGLLSVDTSFTTVKETKTYTVEFTWESTNNDTAYAGAGFGTAAEITVIGTQAV